MIVFKQSYKSRSDPAAPGLNVRHLQYIATRPGVIHNQGCGFGLWGQMPGHGPPGNITDLQAAKKELREVSERRTVYRAVLSVDQKDAAEKGLYDRSKWEGLVERHISVIAKEMDIRPENFRWLASMHYAKGHPHVHLMYWDSGTEPRPEFVSREQFEIMAEHVRADFGKELYREELQENQALQKSELKLMRSLLLATCREANPEAALNLQRLDGSPQAAALGDRLAEIVRQLPARGSLDYGYLPPDCKAAVDALIDDCAAQVPELAREIQRYEKAAATVAALYGNGADTAARNMDKAKGKLRRELGNEVMKAVRELTQELKTDHPESRQALAELIHTRIPMVAQSDPLYQGLLAAMPLERIPWDKMEDQLPGWEEAMKKLVANIAGDYRIRFQVQGYLEEERKAAGLEPGSDEAKALGKEIYREVYRETWREITSSLRADAGWTAEACQTSALSMLCGMMRCASVLGSQEANRCRVKASTRNRSRDKSRDAKRDDRAVQRQAGSWEQE